MRADVVHLKIKAREIAIKRLTSHRMCCEVDLDSPNERLIICRTAVRPLDASATGS